MKCIDKYLKIFSCVLLSCSMLSGCAAPAKTVTAYEKQNYEKTSYRAEGFSDALCVSTDDVSLDSVTTDSSLSASGLFSLNDRKVLYSHNIHKKLYPASVTKVLTALVALKYGNLADNVTISKNATTFPAGGFLSVISGRAILLLWKLCCMDYSFHQGMMPELQLPNIYQETLTIL